MAAISMPIAARAEYALHQLAKRDKNWAQREPGVIVVFVIVFLVAILVIAMFINKKVRSPNHPNHPILSPIQPPNTHHRGKLAKAWHKIPPLIRSWSEAEQYDFKADKT